MGRASASQLQMQAQPLKESSHAGQQRLSISRHRPDLGCRDSEDIAFLPPMGQGGEGFFQFGVNVEFPLQLLGDFEVPGFFQMDFYPCPFEIDGLLDVSLDCGPEACHFGDTAEAKLPGRLHVLADSEQQFFRVSQQSAFEKHQGDVCVEPLNEEDVPVLKRVAGLAPLDSLSESAALRDLSQGLRFLRVLVARMLHG